MATPTGRRGYYPPLKLIPVPAEESAVSSSSQRQKRALEKTDYRRDRLSPSTESIESKSSEERRPKRMRQTTLLEATQKQWTPPEGLIVKSVADHWAAAIQEWEAEKLEIISSYHRSKQCVCGLESRKVCHISNKENGEVAQLGQCCFSKIKDAGAVLSQVSTMFDSVEALRKNHHNAANVALIEFAAKKGILKARDREFYLSTRNQDYSHLTIKQKGYRVGLNDRIVRILEATQKQWTPPEGLIVKSVANQWTPPEGLIVKSVADHWAAAIQEWEAEKLEIISSYHRSKQCVCGLESRKVCHISNKENGEVAQLGQCCFSKIKDAGAVLSQVSTMFDSVEALRKNHHNAANVALIEFAAKKGILKARDREFYLSTRNQDYSHLTSKQKGYRVGLNDRIVTMIRK